MSPEELRLDAYTAMQQGTVDIYVSEYLKIMQTRGAGIAQWLEHRTRD